MRHRYACWVLLPLILAAACAGDDAVLDPPLSEGVVEGHLQYTAVMDSATWGAEVTMENVGSAPLTRNLMGAWAVIFDQRDGERLWPDGYTVDLLPETFVLQPGETYVTTALGAGSYGGIRELLAGGEYYVVVQLMFIDPPRADAFDLGYVTLE